MRRTSIVWDVIEHPTSTTTSGKAGICITSVGNNIGIRKMNFKIYCTHVGLIKTRKIHRYPGCISGTFHFIAHSNVTSVLGHPTQRIYKTDDRKNKNP